MESFSIEIELKYLKITQPSEDVVNGRIRMSGFVNKPTPACLSSTLIPEIKDGQKTGRNELVFTAPAGHHTKRGDYQPHKIRFVDKEHILRGKMPLSVPIKSLVHFSVDTDVRIKKIEIL